MTDLAQHRLLDVADLSVEFTVPSGTVTGVGGVSFDVGEGETLGIVGESGSGKSVTCYAIMGLLARNGRVASGRVAFRGTDLLTDPKALNAVRGREVAFIFQNPRAALNPLRPVGEQIRDTLKVSRRPPASRAEGIERAVALLDLVQIAKAADRYSAFPHELSGGMCQRIMIAMALAAEPKLLIADEPTTGLDVTTQRRIMDTLRDLARDRGLATILITHDLGLAAEYCRRIVVMAQGRVVETGTTGEILGSPAQEYTRRLVAATPHGKTNLIELLPETDRVSIAHQPAAEIQTDRPPLLDVRDLGKIFGRSAPSLLTRVARRLGGHDAEAKAAEADKGFHAVDEVSFSVARGESLGIVGESGSGKTTTSRMIARLLDASSGSIVFDGRDIANRSSKDFATSPDRRRMQVVFQDPLGSLNPSFTAYDAIRDSLRRCGRPILRDGKGDERSKIIEAAKRSGLDPNLLGRFPHQLSGGQQARVGIGRALVVEPELLILDEPTSALDVSVQALVLNQLAQLRAELGLTLIFVSHDLNVVRLFCDRVVVMKQGRIVETGTSAEIFNDPRHDYTRQLIDAVPRISNVAASKGHERP